MTHTWGIKIWFRQRHTCWNSPALQTKYFCFPLCWSPNPQYDGIWKWGHWEVIKSWGWYPYKKRHRRAWALSLPVSSSLSLSFSQPCEDTKRRHPFASQKEGSHQNLTTLAPWSQTSQSPELWEINFTLRDTIYAICYVSPSRLRHSAK